MQFVWSNVAPDGVGVEVAGRSFEVHSATPPGAERAAVEAGSRAARARRPASLVIGGLDPGRRYDLDVRSGRQHWKGSFTTLTPPPGKLLAKVATVSDLHIGERFFGPAKRLRETNLGPAADPYPVRAARAAINEAEDWGAELIVAKGDLTDRGSLGQIRLVAEILSQASVPVEAILGNHDITRGSIAAGVDPVGELGRAGIAVAVSARSVSIAGVQLVLGHTPVVGKHGGDMADSEVRTLVDLASDGAGPALVVLHHPPARHRVPTYYPPALAAGSSRQLVEALAAGTPDCLILAGHTHRNRRYRVRGVEVSEVGSTKDYPGCWAGYAIHEGGVRQVVRRIAAPDVIGWTEETRRALGGVWGQWSPGRLSDRCWTLNWTGR